ncbi:MAG: hypothetical protein RIR62_2206 [Pseudomonadota bacterium]|jgi:drug/metabolite transporter (DMT)-like permease
MTFHAKDNLRGILLMVLGMGLFALEDTFIKLAAADLPAGFILMVIGLVGIPFFWAMARAQGSRVLVRAAFHPAVIGRNLGEMLGTFGFVTALTLAPLADVSAVAQAMPLFVTMGAALFLGETVGWRRWTAIVVGFLGVLMVIRPGFAGFDPDLLWALVAVVGLGSRDLFTRRVPQSITTMQLSVWAFMAVVLLGAGMVAVSGGVHMPGPWQMLWMGCASVVGIAAYWALTQANRLGEMSVITPFRYSRILFALALGILVFGERPDVMTLCGAAVIVGSGIYTFARERAARQRALSMTAPTR